MDVFIEFIFQHVDYAPLIVFGLLMLAGLNLPISEDLLIISSAAIASQSAPEQAVFLYLGAFLGAYLSDWEAYWIGRWIRKKVVLKKWFANNYTVERQGKIKLFYEKYGFWTLVIGRFIPFGVRNGLFMVAGAGEMNFIQFLISDGIACFFSTSALFLLTYACGKNYQWIYGNIAVWNVSIFIIFIASLIITLLFTVRKKYKKKQIH